jgi:HSP20 family protein
MSTKALTRTGELFPSLFDDFFKPWNEIFGNGGSLIPRALTVPAVNITDEKDEKKDDFRIDVEGNLLTISCEKEEKKEEKEKRHTRLEYNYTSFSRSFTLPEDVKQDKIEARYTDGVLHLSLPKKEEAKKAALARHIDIH